MSNNSDDGSRWSRYRIPSLFELFFGICLIACSIDPLSGCFCIYSLTHQLNANSLYFQSAIWANGGHNSVQMLGQIWMQFNMPVELNPEWSHGLPTLVHAWIRLLWRFSTTSLVIQKSKQSAIDRDPVLGRPPWANSASTLFWWYLSNWHAFDPLLRLVHQQSSY